MRAPLVAQRGDAKLYRVGGGPLRLAAAVTGVYSDGWMGGKAAYTRYDVSRDGPGFAVVKLSRERWCPSPSRRRPGVAAIRIGPVGIGPDKQPAIARVTGSATLDVEDCKADAVLLSTPSEPWRVEVTVTPTFSPHEVDPSRSDRRELGAVFQAGFESLFGD
jgi:hypothetical protein